MAADRSQMFRSAAYAVVEDKFLVKHRRGKYRLTRKGRREIGALPGLSPQHAVVGATG
jgi:hypothetical protein